MYGVLYAISPEIFPAKDRGTGNAMTATATRVFGILVGDMHTCTPTALLIRNASRLRLSLFTPTCRRPCPFTSAVR
jgi:hypothetical protein